MTDANVTPEEVVVAAMAAAAAGKEAEPAVEVAADISNLWPNVPSDDSFIAGLVTDAVLKVDESTIMAAIRAATASKHRLFQLPDLLVDEMEKTAEKLEDPCGPEWYDLRDLITVRRYADVLNLYKVKGTFMTKERTGAFLDKLNSLVWPALYDFHEQLQAFRDNIVSGISNPTAAIALLTGRNVPFGHLAVRVPSTEVLRNSALAVRMKINRAFGGHGIVCARALAYEAGRVKDILNNPALPVQVGYLNRDQMLKGLGVAQANDVVQQERDLVTFAVAVTRLPDLPHGEAEEVFIGNLCEVDMNLAPFWENIGGQSAVPAARAAGRRPF